LPQATTLVEEMLAELVADSEESAFERSILPAGIERRLAQVDWTKNDVLVGSVGSREQFEDNIARKYYYVPAKYISQEQLPIHYVAIYQSSAKFGGQSGIRYYGETIEVKRLKRSEIRFPSRRNNPDEPYYAFLVKEWKELPVAITVKDEGVYAPKFTNLFLLQHCSQSHELFNIHTDDEYRIMHELKRVFSAASMNANDSTDSVYQLDPEHSVWVHGGNFDVINSRGERLFDPPLKISNFMKHPSRYFKLLKDRINGKY
jgi:hypothetical protein